MLRVNNRYIVILIALLMVRCYTPLYAMWNRAISDNIHTVLATVNNDWRLPPIIQLGSDDYITISFDDMSHNYNRYTYHIEHCNRKWEPSKLYESDYIDGFNDMPIDNYSPSIATTFNYTHYYFTLPNQDTSFKISGNYILHILDSDRPVASVRFAIVDPKVKLEASVSSNTDISTNSNHQQLSISINHSGVSVVNPSAQIAAVVIQNGDIENRVESLEPDYSSGHRMDYLHNRKLIFPAGNEFRRFEVIDMYDYSQHVEKISFHSPYYHATLNRDRPFQTYQYDNDHNGRFLVRSINSLDSNTEADYLFVHFALESPNIGDVYLQGCFSGYKIDNQWRMEYNYNDKAYQKSILLKQGAYNYRYVVCPTTTKPHYTNIDGNHYETENEYLILVYYQPNGGYYDQLVAYQLLSTTSRDK